MGRDSPALRVPSGSVSKKWEQRPRRSRQLGVRGTGGLRPSGQRKATCQSGSASWRLRVGSVRDYAARWPLSCVAPVVETSTRISTRVVLPSYEGRRTVALGQLERPDSQLATPRRQNRRELTICLTCCSNAKHGRPLKGARRAPCRGTSRGSLGKLESCGPWADGPFLAVLSCLGCALPMRTTL